MIHQKYPMTAFTTIKDHSLQALRSAPITDVVGHFVKLKEQGANHHAPCPFHLEKTASFVVSQTKGIYKCFGCGAHGDAIKFVMQHENKAFIEACKTVAQLTHTTIDFEEREITEKEKATITAAQAQEEVLNHVVPIYTAALMALPADHPAKQFLYNRGYNDDVIAEWQLGWGGTEWHNITPQLISKGCFEAAHALGIIKRSADGEKNYDGYRNRITIPITNSAGRYVGLGGRHIEDQSIQHSTSHIQPKYINPPDCELYNKSNFLFGLSKAAAAIRENKKAYLVEGYFDVIGPHTAGLQNVVGTCGTSFTPQQMALLKKHTDHIVLWRDNDAAGQKANNRQLPDLLQNGFRVDVGIYDGKDPGEWIQQQSKKVEDIQSPNSEDFLMTRIREIKTEAVDPFAISAAKKEIYRLLAHVADSDTRDAYVEVISKEFKWKASDIKKGIEPFLNIDRPVAILEKIASHLPDELTEEQKQLHAKNGYVAINDKGVCGYYSYKVTTNADGKTSTSKTEITNFTVNPLFHVYAGADSRFLLEIDNGFNHAVLDIPAKIIPSIEQFQANAVAEGNFIIFGAKPQWLRIASDLLKQFPRCIELKNLGWQSHNFFAFADKVFIPKTTAGQQKNGLQDLDNWGIVKIENENFLIPASCEAYRQLKHTGDDPFENDRHLTFKQSEITLESWAKQMHRVYNQQGIIAIAGVIMSLFRDIVFSIDNNCPHLYAFGEPSSGKSKWAESITAVFFHKRSAFNLNSGTDFAFFNYLQRYTNCPAHLNEFEIEVIKPEWFEAIKGIYDGEGRERGKMGAGTGSRNRTEIMKVRSVLVLTGQKLITANDNSVVTRSLVEGFSVRDDISEDDKEAYNTLKDWEAKGMSSILLELLQHRKEFEDNYRDVFNKLLSKWRIEKTGAKGLNQRILQNWAHLAIGYTLVEKYIKLPQTAAEFSDYCYSKAVHWSHFIRNSDTLSSFWRTLEFLVDDRKITEGWDYIIKSETAVKWRDGNHVEHTKEFNEPTKVLYLRLGNVHSLFQQHYRSRNSQPAMSLENLKHYFQSRKYFIGVIKQMQFRRFEEVTEERTSGGLNEKSHGYIALKPIKQITSCHAFVFDDLNLSIERIDDTNNNLPFP